MKRALAILSLLVLGMPALALADENTAPAVAPAVRQQVHQEMRQARAQMHQLHAQARAETLSALTTAHRQLLANVVGQLAIAANPDREAAARQLNAALSASERQAILNIHQNFVTQAKALRASIRAQIGSQLPADMQAKLAQRAAKAQARAASRSPLDAGNILLRVAMGGKGHGARGEMH